MKDIADCPVCHYNTFKEIGSGYDFEYRTTMDTFHFVRCMQCGLLFLNPMPEEQDLNRFYPPNYYIYETKSEKGFIGKMAATLVEGQQRKRMEGYIRHVPEGSGPFRILDIGCGDGKLLLQAKNILPGAELFGVEMNEKTAEEVKKRGINIFSGKFEDSEFPPDSFDLIICQQIIEHVVDPGGFLKKIFLLLKKDGATIIETPNYRTLDYYLSKKRYWGGYHIPRHLHIFDENSMRRLMEGVGFGVKEINYLPCYAFWIWTLHNLFWDKNIFRSFADRFFTVDNVFLAGMFFGVEFLKTKFHKTANMQVIATKGHITI